MSEDRVNELYARKVFTHKSQEACRDRIHWICAQATGKTVLDCGCSQGIVSILLARAGYKVVGIDVNPDAIEYARRELMREPDGVRNNLTFDVVAAGALPFENQSFDTIVFGEVIEHLTHPELVLEELKRVLIPGGIIVMTTPFGVHPHTGHVQTFCLGSFLKTVDPFFRTQEISIRDKYIRYVGTSFSDRLKENSPAVKSKHLLSITEAAFIESEHQYLETQLALQTRNKDYASKQVKLAQELAASSKQLKEFQSQLDACLRCARESLSDAVACASITDKAILDLSPLQRRLERVSSKTDSESCVSDTLKLLPELVEQLVQLCESRINEQADQHAKGFLSQKAEFSKLEQVVDKALQELQEREEIQRDDKKLQLSNEAQLAELERNHAAKLSSNQKAADARLMELLREHQAELAQLHRASAEQQQEIRREWEDRLQVIRNEHGAQSVAWERKHKEETAKFVASQQNIAMQRQQRLQDRFEKLESRYRAQIAELKRRRGQHLQEKLSKIRQARNAERLGFQRRIKELRQRLRQKLQKGSERVKQLITAHSRSTEALQAAQQREQNLREQLESKSKRLVQLKHNLVLTRRDIRYRVGDAMVRAVTHPLDLLLLPWRLMLLFFEGLRGGGQQKKQRPVASADRGARAVIHPQQANAQTSLPLPNQDQSKRGIKLKNQGIEAYKRSDYHAAQSYLEQAIRLDDTRGSNWLWRARAQLQLDDFESSLASVRRALELQPNWYAATWHLVEIYTRQDRQADCLKLLDQIRVQHASNAMAIRQVAKQFLRLKAYDSASKAADQLSQLAPDDLDAVYVKAFSIWKSGDPTAALQIIEKRSTKNAALVRLSCQIHLERGDSPAAWSVLAGERDEVVDENLLVQVAEELRKNGHVAFASQAEKRLRKRAAGKTRLGISDPAAGEATNSLTTPGKKTSANSSQGVKAKLQKATTERKKLSELGKNLTNQGIEACKRFDYKAALAYLDEAIRLDETSETTWLWLARAQLQLADFESSLASTGKALELKPDCYRAMWHLVEIYSRQDRHADCLELLEKIRVQHAANPTAIRQVAKQLLRQKAYEAAGLAADQLLELVPGDADAAYVKAYSAWKCGDPAATLRMIENSSKTTASLVRLRCQVLLEAGDSKAVWSIVKAEQDDVVDQDLLIRIANALRKDGHISLVCQVRERILKRDPGNPQLSDAYEAAIGEKIVLQDQWRPPGVLPNQVVGIPGRVLHVVGKSVPHSHAGYTVRTQSIARSQRDAGLDPHVVTQLGFPWEQGVTDCEDVDLADGIPYYRLRADNGCLTRLDNRMSCNVEELVKLAQRLKPSVLHAASDFVNALMALEAGRRLGLPVVYEVRGFWEETWLSKSSNAEVAATADAYLLRRERELQCMLSADHVVTLAETMKQVMEQRGVPGENITVVPNAVDTTDFVPQQRDDALAMQLGIVPGEVVVGYISSFVGYEGIRFLIDAVAKLLSRGINVRALLVGDGARAVLEAQAAELGIADRVIFTGRVPHADVLKYYGLIDLFVVPRTNDRVSQLVTPLKPYEAMATGRALIVSRVPALCEMIEEGVSGLTFRPEDANDLAAVLQGLIENPQRRLELGQTARQWVCQHRTWKQNGQRYADLYRSLGVA